MKEVINLKQTDLPPKEYLLEDRGQSITFYDDFILYFSSGKWDLPKEDDSQIRTKSFFDNTYVFSKSGAWGFEMYYHNESKRYILDIGSIKIAFGNNEESPKIAREQCKDLFNKIVKWKFGIEL